MFRLLEFWIFGVIVPPGERTSPVTKIITSCLVNHPIRAIFSSTPKRTPATKCEWCDCCGALLLETDGLPREEFCKNLFDTIAHTNYYANCMKPNGIIEAVQLREKIELPTTVGPLIPVFEVDDHGRKKLAPVRMYPSGAIFGPPLFTPNCLKIKLDLFENQGKKVG